MAFGRKKKEIKVIDEPEEESENGLEDDDESPEEEEQEEQETDKPKRKLLQKKPTSKPVAKIIAVRTREDGLYDYSIVTNVLAWQVGEVFDL